jgi:hypothetical protein
MGNEKIDLKATEGISRNNLLLYYAKKISEDEKAILNPANLKEEDMNQSILRVYERTGILFDEILSMQQKVNLDDYGADILLQSILDLMDILSFKKPLPEAIDFFSNRVLQAYAIANRYSTGEGKKIFYKMTSAIAENSTRIDQTAIIDESFLGKIKALYGRNSKKSKSNSNSGDGFD